VSESRVASKAVALNTWTPIMVEKSVSKMATFPIKQGRTDFLMCVDAFQRPWKDMQTI
jgi:hypothetical protein